MFCVCLVWLLGNEDPNNPIPKHGTNAQHKIIETCVTEIASISVVHTLGKMLDLIMACSSQKFFCLDIAQPAKLYAAQTKGFR